MARVSLEASPPSPEVFSLSANPCHLYWGSCQRRGWRGAFKAKKKNSSQFPLPTSQHFFLPVYYTQFLSIWVTVYQT